MAPIILPSGKVFSQKTAESAERGVARIAESKETGQLGELLARLSPPLAVEFRAILAMSAVRSLADPSGWAPTTVSAMARGMLDADFALGAAGIRVDSVADFDSDEAVEAILARYTTPSGSQRNAGRILCSVRTLVRLRSRRVSRNLTRAIRRAEKTPRRGDGEVLPTAEACLAGAMVEFHAALDLMRSGSPRRGRTRLRDAVILAVEIATNFRRGEFAAITLSIVFFDDAQAQVRIVIPESASKVREVQLGYIRDSETIEMLRAMIKDRRSGHLFQTNWGAALASASGYKAIKRVGKRATGVALNFNKARRIGVTAETTAVGMRGRVRHALSSEVAEQVYACHADDLGIEECRKSLASYGVVQP